MYCLSILVHLGDFLFLFNSWPFSLLHLVIYPWWIVRYLFGDLLWQTGRHIFFQDLKQYSGFSVYIICSFSWYTGLLFNQQFKKERTEYVMGLDMVFCLVLSGLLFIIHKGLNSTVKWSQDFLCMCLQLLVVKILVPDITCVYILWYC